MLSWRYHLKQRVIAFIDILGFKNLTQEFQEDSILNFISPFYLAEASNEERKKLDQELGIDYLELHTEEITFFSDCIVISCDPKEVSTIIIKVRNLVQNFIGYGLYLRGGITYGSLFHQDRIVFGSAMNEAYKIESECAIYPRVVISDGLHELIKDNTNAPVSREEYYNLEGLYKINEDLKPLNNIFRDNDGFYYLNPFPHSVALTERNKRLGINSLLDFVLYFKSSIEKKLEEYKMNKKYFSKYYWLAVKFNEYYNDQEKVGTIKL